MRYRTLLNLVLLLLIVPAASMAQPAIDKPVTKGEVFAALELARSSETLVKRTNDDLIAEIQERGVDFVLTPVEEWQLELRDASEELLAAIRDGVEPAEREYRIRIRQQETLYLQFATNFNAADLAGRQTALNAGNQFLSLYSDDANVAEIVGFIRKNLPRLQQSVTILQQREAAAERTRIARERRSQERIQRDRQRREAAAARNRSSAAPQAKPQPSPTPTPAGKKEAPRQPSDPVNRPLIPGVRRP